MVWVRAPCPTQNCVCIWVIHPFFLLLNILIRSSSACSRKKNYTWIHIISWTFELLYHQVVHCVDSETTVFSNSKDKQNSFLVNYLSDFCVILFGLLGAVRFEICYYSILISESKLQLHCFSVSDSIRCCSLRLQPVRLTESFDSAPFFSLMVLIFVQQIVRVDCAFHCRMQ